MNAPGKLPSGARLKLPEGYEVLESGPTHDVVTKITVRKQIAKSASAEQKTGLHDLVERYGKGGWACIPRGKFNASEGSYPTSTGKRVRLEAFKPRQLRAYGFCQEFNGRPTFFITGVDTSKKQDRANQTILQTAGAEAVRVFEHLEQGG